MSDLGDVLARAGLELGGQTRPMDETALRRVVAGARRRRVRRHAYQGVAAAAAIAVLGAGGWWGVQRQEPVPAQTPTPAVTPSTPAPTPTSSPTPTVDPGPVVRETATDDATVLRRLAAPRTGETWHAPEPADDVRLVDDSSYGPVRTLRVGERGAAEIYLVVSGFAMFDRRETVGLFEVDQAGARYIACPAPVADDCAEPLLPSGAQLAPGVSVDPDTFYDTLGVPGRAELVGGFTVGTRRGIGWEKEIHAQDGSPVALGNAVLLVDDAPELDLRPTEVVVLARTGPTALVELRWPSEIGGLVNVEYAWRTPFGTVIPLRGDDVPGGYWDTIVWDDGVDRRLYPDDVDASEQPGSTRAPSSGNCVPGHLTLEEGHVAADWRAAGRTPEGVRVYVPVAGGNPRSREVRALQEKQAWTYDGGSDDGVVQGAQAYATTGFVTDQAFLDANALFAFQRGDGVWLLGLRPDALAPVGECV